MSFNLFDLQSYASGKMHVPGTYCAFFDVRLHQATKQDGSPAGAPRLGAMLSLYPIDEEGNPTPGAEPTEQFISFGGRADQSWAPDPETGKSIVPIPGVVQVPLSNKSNWFYFMSSLQDCCMPPLDGDLSSMDGIWIRTTNVPEPEERKSFKSATAEVEEDNQRRGPGLMVAVSEILAGGMPWEGGGGLAKVAAPAPMRDKLHLPVRRGPQAVARPAAAKPVAKPAVAARPATAKSAAVTDESPEDMISRMLDDSLAALPEGTKSMTKVAARTVVFKGLTAATNQQTATATLKAHFDDVAQLNMILNPKGWEVKGATIAQQS